MSSQAPVQPVAAAQPTPSTAEDRQRRIIIIVAVVVAILVVAGLITGAIVLLNNPVAAANVRDVMIIFMALEFIVIGAALVVLMFQLAVLTNMLQHEIKPILDLTNETINTVRGTTTFLSDNLVEPVVKLNSYLAAITQVVDSLGMLGRFGRRKN